MAESRAGPEPEADPNAERASTAPADPPVRRLRRARAMRRVFFLGLTAVLVAACLGLLGVTTDERSSSEGGYEVSLRYASRTRPGLATPWTVEVRRQGGFSRVVTLAVTSSYFDAFDENGLDPDPLGAVSDGERTIWTFEPPLDSDTMTVSFDARLEPGVQLSHVKGMVEVLEDGRTMAAVRFKTLVLP